MRSKRRSARSRGVMLEMSGARDAGCGGVREAGRPASSSPCGAPWSLRLCVDRAARSGSAGPARSAIEAHERDAGDRPGEGGRGRIRGVCADAPAAVPQRWQNFAPGVRIVAQAAQRAPASGEPQLAQNCPLAAAPQLGQMAEPAAGAELPEEGTVMRGI